MLMMLISDKSQTKGNIEQIDSDKLSQQTKFN